MVYVVYCVASGNQEKVQACLVTLWLFIISCHSLYKTTLGSLCSWKPAWYLKKHPHSMCLKPFVKMCIFVVIQIFWSLRKYREQGKSEGFESCDLPIVRKRPIWVKIGDVLYRVTLKFDGWPWKTIGHLSFAVSSFVQHFIAIGEFKLELQSGNAPIWIKFDDF